MRKWLEGLISLQLYLSRKKAAGKTWTWTYDDVGNITAKKEYNYTTGTLGTALDTVNYTYGNASWGDQLTGYDGSTIMYYIYSGNPARDGTWTYAWEHSRELMRMSSSGKTITANAPTGLSCRGFLIFCLHKSCA